MNPVTEFYDKKQGRGKEEGSHLNRTSICVGQTKHLDSKGLAFLSENTRGSETQELGVSAGRGWGTGNEEELAYFQGKDGATLS